MARRRRRRSTSGLGMVRIKGPLCRSRKGKFTRCKKPVSKGSGSGFAKSHTKGIKGKCLRWSKGRTRCVKRAVGGYRAAKGRCVKWSKGRTRCIRRA